MTNPTPASTTPPKPVFFLSLIGLFLLLVWDHSSLDLGMARWFGSASGFALENHWFWRGVLHDGLRPVPWLIELGLLLAIVKPAGALTQLPVLRRTQLALTTLVALLVVSNIKLHSRTSCPSSLQEFGGMASYVSHWAWGSQDGGDGNCFPAGHASAGFAFLGGFFAFRQRLPAIAARWLAGAALAGLLLGAAQQVRGAHYMSHTFWTAWFCWVTAASMDLAFSQLERRTLQRLRRDPAPEPGL